MSELAPDFGEPLFRLVGAEVLELPVELEPVHDGAAHVHVAPPSELWVGGQTIVKVTSGGLNSADAGSMPTSIPGLVTIDCRGKVLIATGLVDIRFRG